MKTSVYEGSNNKQMEYEDLGKSIGFEETMMPIGMRLGKEMKDNASIERELNMEESMQENNFNSSYSPIKLSS